MPMTDLLLETILDDRRRQIEAAGLAHMARQAGPAWTARLTRFLGFDRRARRLRHERVSG